MSFNNNKFTAFMKGNVQRIRTKKIYISDVFKDSNGNIAPFVIRNINAKDEKSIRESCMVVDETLGIKVLDTAKYEDKLTVACIVEPDLKDKNLQDSYGVIGEEDLLNAMLLTGEYSKLQREITEFNGFKSLEQKKKEVKN